MSVFNCWIIFCSINPKWKHFSVMQNDHFSFIVIFSKAIVQIIDITKKHRKKSLRNYAKYKICFYVFLRTSLQYWICFSCGHQWRNLVYAFLCFYHYYLPWYFSISFLSIALFDGIVRKEYNESCSQSLECEFPWLWFSMLPIVALSKENRWYCLLFLMDRISLSF